MKSINKTKIYSRKKKEKIKQTRMVACVPVAYGANKKKIHCLQKYIKIWSF